MDLDDDLFDDGYVPLAECAARLGISTARVKVLVEQRVLRAYSDGYGSVMVQPALITGITASTGVSAREPAHPKRASSKKRE